MGYTRKYFLERVKCVNEVYLEHASRGMTNEYIYRHYILPRFHISRTTFYQYLTIPYAAQQREMESTAVLLPDLNTD